MKIGLIGCGDIGIKHCKAIKALSAEMDVEISALADMRDECLVNLAAYWPGAELYHTGSDLINSAVVDAVFICLPNYLHCEHAIMAMEKGMAVFIEKPVCLTRHECERLLEAQRKYSSKVYVGHAVRFFKEYTYLKEVFDSGELGELKSLMMSRFCGRAEGWFYQEEKSGTVVLDLHIHDTDFVRWLLGEPQDITVSASCNNNIITHISTTYGFPGTFVTADAVWDVSKAMLFKAGFRAHFEQGTLIYNYNNRRQPAIILYTSEGAVPVELESLTNDTDSAVDISTIEPYYLECKSFIESVLYGQQPIIASLEEGVNSVLLALRELEMAKEWIANH